MEFFYPLYQGYDSVAVKADIEIGGSDQLWNLMMGREIQKFYNQTPQVAMTFPLLVGTDGQKKMSQSYDNYISIKDPPNDIFGKLMSIPDHAMWDYYLMLTDITLKEINTYKVNIENNLVNPFQIKKELGIHILTELYDENIALSASNEFEDITIEKNIPENIPNLKIPVNKLTHLPKVFVDNKITKSTSEARRLIESKSVTIDGVLVDNLDINTENINGKILQVGKRRFFKIN